MDRQFLGNSPYALPSTALSYATMRRKDDCMAGERKFVWFNTATESDLYEEANRIQFSTEVKKWLRQRILERKKSDLEKSESCQRN
ncbi:hypothetical protein ACOJUR_11965 [Alicyclobacillus tolerans]|uniref:hypothetical protein n=1 Tax=Alicyclobacillus tolerans TaxID=90970 RepID=UPI003B78F86C